MEFLFSLSTILKITNMFALMAPILFIYLLFCRSSKKKAPPEPAGAWPIIGHLPHLAGSTPPYITMGKWADEYGPIFTIRVGVHRTLVVSNWEMANECLTTNNRVFCNRPRSLASEILGYNYSMFGFGPYGSYWRLIRKIVTQHCLSNERLEKLKHVREGEIKAAVEGLYQQCIKKNKLLVEMKRWFRDITLNLIFRITVGKAYVDYNTNICSESGSCGKLESDRWRESVRDFFELSGKFAVADAIPFLRVLDLGGVEKAMKKIAKELDNAVGIWLEEHKQTKASGIAKEQEDFMDVMLSILDNTNTEDIAPFSPDTVNKSTCLAILLASADTIAVTLIWTLCLLLNNPHVLKKVQEELDTKVGKERQVKESDMKNLVYLQAVIKESLRVCAPVPLSVPRESVEDCVVGGYHIPAGTRLLVNVFKIHQDSRVWSDPYEFQPERFFAPPYKDFDVRGQNLELIPFGSGRRICPGISFSIQVLNLTFASLIHGFEMETPLNEPVDMSGSGGLSNYKATPLEVLLTPRLPPHLYN